MKSSEITYKKHGQYYDFSNAEELVDELLLNVKNKFKSNGQVVIKCGFTIQNIQPAPTEHDVPILTVCYRSTELYKTIYFHDFFYPSRRYTSTCNY